MEVFARFIARFVEWTHKNAAMSGFSEDYRKDKFTELDFRRFVYLLQEKSYLDAKYAQPNL